MQKKTSKKRNRNFFRGIYNESWEYIKESKNFIYFSITLFLLFFLLGFFIPTPENVQKIILQFINELLDKTQGMSQGNLISFIFFNNLQTSFFSILFGVVLSIFPIITSISNGYLLGFVAIRTVQEEGVFVLWRLFPHGIFELPALFISLGMGIKLGTFILKRNKIRTIRVYLIKTAKVFIFVVVPLLLIAAIIEGTLISLFS